MLLSIGIGLHRIVSGSSKIEIAISLLVSLSWKDVGVSEWFDSLVETSMK